MEREIHLKNELGELKRLADFVTRTAADLSLDGKLCMRLNLALEEAVANVILYAYPEGKDKDRDITVRIEETGGSLVVTLIDSGIAFDPTRKERPDIFQPAEERPVGGLGIYLIREIMTAVTYRRRGNKNVLTMIKDLH